ncbi:Metallo-hydrolase/oxidoreductase [Coniochaeta ligniaria NRRL 30616]|uniref:Metallo-hydrolase/oxidoreductase n=1 Tax=Coniochaeta ligniaria NRRL 30616 TaxID=1408157 RepID=A0A1J7IR42_9PEZI|nr:Metallo-hydrolase/oxidoreductase [Coniochaeta ligniaria NRRL 30616]
MRLISAMLLAIFAATSSGREMLAIPTWAPVPAELPLNSAGYRVETFGGGAYMVTDNQYNCLFFVSTKGVLVIDAPASIGHNLAYAIGNTTDKQVTHFIYSHAHSDHVGGAYLFGNATRIAHSITKKLLSAVPSPDEPLPDVTFEDEYHLSHGNLTLQLSYKGANHQPGNIFIYAPEQKVLMLVDVIFPGWAPFAYLGEAEDTPGFVRAHDQVLEYDFDHFVGGHATRSGVRADVVAQREYVNDLLNNCNAAVALSEQPANATNPISQQYLVSEALQANPGNVWAAFKLYFDSMASYCNNVTNQKWLGRLSAVDVYGQENSYAMIVALFETNLGRSG